MKFWKIYRPLTQEELEEMIITAIKVHREYRSEVSRIWSKYVPSWIKDELTSLEHMDYCGTYDAYIDKLFEAQERIERKYRSKGWDVVMIEHEEGNITVDVIERGSSVTYFGWGTIEVEYADMKRLREIHRFNQKMGEKRAIREFGYMFSNARGG